MKVKMMTLVAMVSVLAGFNSAALAQDASVVFRCKSLPTVDSDLTVLGVADQGSSTIELVVVLSGQVVANDRGQFIAGTSRFEGSVFNMDFAEITETRLTAKSENKVLAVGQTDSVNCEFEGLQ